MEGNEEVALAKSSINISPFFLLVASAIAIFSMSIITTGSMLGWGQPTPEQLMAEVYPTTPEIIYTDDFRNCGANGGKGGCYQPFNPDTIYISTGLSYPVLKYVTLHELAHYVQGKEGLEFSECDADLQAREWGADIRFSGYKKECPLVDY